MTLRSVFASVAIISLAGVPVAIAADSAAPATADARTAAAPLEGSRWEVTVTPDAAAAKKGEQAFADTLVFSKGKVEMTECVKVGFAASDYKTAMVGDAWSFATEQKNDKSEKTEWKAEIKNDTIKGTLASHKPDGTVLNYSFEGKKAK